MWRIQTSRSNTFDPLTDLSIGDIQFHIHERYFTLQLKRSKTDPFGKGVTLKYFATKQNICPFQTMMPLLQTRIDVVAQSHDPLFTTLTRAPAIDTLFLNRETKDISFQSWLQSIFV